MAKYIDVFSARFSLVLIIFLMGMMGFFFAVLTGEWYKALALENEHYSLSQILQNEVTQDLKDHSEDVEKLAQTLYKTAEFKQALKKNDHALLKKLLNNQFYQYFVTVKRIDLSSLSLLDLDFNEVVRATEHSMEGLNEKSCQKAIQRAKARSGTERLKILADLCADEDYALHMLIVPIGGLVPTGYLMIISNPVSNLIGIGEELNTPIKIQLANGKLLDQLGEWPDGSQFPKWAKIEYVASSLDKTQSLVISIYKENTELYKKLKSARLKILLIVCLITGLAILLVFYMLNNSLLVPLKKLGNQLQLIHCDRRHLGKAIAVKGNSEVRNLAEKFNDMSSELKSLYNQLENIAFSDPLTKLPNRARFYEDLEQLSRLAERNKKEFSLLFLDLDKFKPINDQYGHQVGDEVLKVISLRISSMLRGSDYLARVNTDQKENNYQDSLSRLGGDEFAVVLPEVGDSNGAIKVAEKIIASVGLPINVGDLTLQVGVSIGIALYPHDGKSTEMLIHYADLAMFHAKYLSLGYACYNPSMLKE